MKLTFTSWWLVALVAPPLAALQPASSQNYESLKKLETAFNRFSIELFTKLIEADPNSNVFVAPACIYMALAMLYAGAGGDTKDQLASALHLDVFTNDDEFYKTIKTLEQFVARIQKNITLQTDARMFTQDGFQPSDDYNQMLSDYFPYQLETLDFNGDPSGATSRINDWISQTTNNNIQEIFPDGTITSDTHLVVASAVTFSSLWKYKFDAKNTKQQTFTTYAKDQVQVPMMSRAAIPGLQFYKTPEFQILSLPSAGGKLATAIVLLPKNLTNSATQRRRALARANDGTMKTKPTKVTANLRLPSFTLSSTANVKDALKALGITALFDESAADLSGIDPDHAVPLSEISHKSFVSFNEDGQEFAWSTQDLIRRPGKNAEKVIDFVVHRPFAFLVYEPITECVFFHGYVANPLQ